LNENLIAVSLLVASVGLAWLGFDDGSLCKMVVTAFLGFIIGKRVEFKKKS